MRNLNEDNSGFILFPTMRSGFKRTDGKTLVYLVAYTDTNNYLLSNNNLSVPSKYVTDDVSGKTIKNITKIISSKVNSGINLVSSICIGWYDSCILLDNNNYWYANFKDLTMEGRKLYYCIKKLHNNKEVRILTFNETY